MRKRPFAYKLLFLSFFLWINQLCIRAQPGELDSTFNETGRATTGTLEEHMFGWTSVIEPGGKLIVAGSLDSLWSSYKGYSVAIRYNLNGTPDSSFGQFGRLVSDFGSNQHAKSIAITSENKILIGGANHFNSNASKSFLVRYDSNGKLDSSFGSYGYIHREYNVANGGGEEIITIKLYLDGDILVVIRRTQDWNAPGKYLLAKYYPNGTLDSTFGTLGILELEYEWLWGNHFIEVQNDKKFIIVGQNKISSIGHFDVRRYLPNGQPDLSFNNTGHVSTVIDSLGSEAFAVKVQPDLKIIVAGEANRKLSYNNNISGSDLAIIRYNPNGTIDSTFAMNGVSLTSSIMETDSPSGGIGLQSDGKIILGVTVDDDVIAEGIYGVVRYLKNGSLDSTFADNGKKILYAPPFEGTCHTMQLYRNRIYLTGWANNYHANVDAFSTGFNTFAIQNDGIPLANVYQNLCDGDADITFSSDMLGATYQWQISTDGTSFTDINNDNNHSGTASLALLINNNSSSWNGYRYRCVTDNGISNVFTLQFMNTWTGVKSTAWEDIGNWSCGSLPDSNTDVVIKHGPVVINSNTSIRSMIVSPGVTLTVNPGYDLNIAAKILGN